MGDAGATNCNTAECAEAVSSDESSRESSSNLPDNYTFLTSTKTYPGAFRNVFLSAANNYVHQRVNILARLSKYSHNVTLQPWKRAQAPS